MKTALVILLFVGVAVAQFRPAPPTSAPRFTGTRTKDAEVTIVKQFFDEAQDGSTSWGFQNSDGTERQERISFKNFGTPDQIQVSEGFFTYYDAEGKLVKITYKADEGGFQILEDNRLV